MLWGPIDRELVENTARPEASIAELPMVVAPSLKVTMPLGIPEPLEGDTVAAKVTCWPKLLGFGEDVTVVVDEFFVTTCENTADVEDAVLGSPE